MHKYHVILADGTERDIIASEIILDNGSLVFRSDYGDPTVVYAPDTWVMVEVERKDDKE